MKEYEDPNDKTSADEQAEQDDDLITDKDLDGVFGAGTYWPGDDGSGS